MSEHDAPKKLPAWLAGPLDADVAASLARLQRTDGVRRIAVMPDVHLCHDVCIGTAVATDERLFPKAVGGDIGCGMAAMSFDCDVDVLTDRSDAMRVLRALGTMVPANRHSRLTMPDALPDHLVEQPLSDPALEKLKRRTGRVQFGTLGRGNHFLEFQRDDEARLWIMVHSGSRAMGQSITKFHGRRTRTADTGLAFLDVASDAGQAYLNDVRWACEYAEASRRRMMDATAALMEEIYRVLPVDETIFSCHHNHVQREEHFGQPYWVHRKGALSARDGERGIIPGSMGTSSFHVIGRGCEAALCSSSHGAGRTLSRSEARRTIRATDLRRVLRGVWYDAGMEDALREEAPAAYKDIGAVMRAQRELTCIVRRLRPILSYKGR